LSLGRGSDPASRRWIGIPEYVHRRCHPLAWRTTWIVKPERLADAVALISKASDAAKGVPSGLAVRTYASNLGPSDTLVFEEVWPTMEAHDRWWAEYGQSPEYAAFLEPWYQVVERAVSTELWNVTERKW